MKSVNFLTKKSIYKQILNKNFSNKTITVELPPILESSEFEKFENTFPKTSTTNTDELVRYYKTLYLWRRFEYEADNLYKQNFITYTLSLLLYLYILYFKKYILKRGLLRFV